MSPTPTITLQQGTFGEEIEVLTGRDLADVSAIRVVFTPVGGAPVSHDYDDTIITDAARGVMAIPLQPGDLAVVGEYEYQWADITGGRYIPGVPGRVIVLPNATGMASR